MFDPKVMFLPPELRPKAEPYHKTRIGRLCPGQPEPREHPATDTRMTGEYRSDCTYRLRPWRSKAA